MTAKPGAAEQGDEFARLLAWAYRGEVMGEAMFDALADAWAPDEHAADVRLLADLERGMAAALKPLLDRFGVDGGDDDRSRRTGRDNAAAIVDQGYQAFLIKFRPATDAALERYRQLRTLAASGSPVLDALVAHEEALQSFAEAQLGARPRAASTSAIREVIAVLADGALLA